MRPQADAATEVPPHEVGGSSASGTLTDSDRAAMEARVAALKLQYADVPTMMKQPEPEAEPEVSFEDLEAFITAADAQANGSGAPVAKATRRGPKRPASKAVRKRKAPVTAAEVSDADLMAQAGIEPFYSTAEAAQFFDRSTQWIYWGLGRDAKKGKGPVFVHEDGTPIEPERVGVPPNERRRFTLGIIRDILLSSYRRGNIDPDELKKILRRINTNECGGEWRVNEGWHKIKGKWVHPDDCTQIGGKWVKKKGSPDESRDVQADTD